MAQRESKRTAEISNPKRREANGTRQQLSRDEVRRAKNAERKKKRRRNRIIGYCAAVIVVIAAAVVLSVTVFFKIDTFSVSGDEVYGSEQIISASGLQTGDNMFLFDKDEAQLNIETNLPYVESAEIERSVTGVLTINITAAKAALAIDTGDSYILLNSSGKVLEDGVMLINDDVAVIKASSVVYSQPGYTAEFQNADDINAIISVKQSIDEFEIPNITEIDVTDAANIKLGYSNRITLKIGAASSLSEKAEFIKATLERHDEQEPTFEGTIDFTVDNKAYVNPEDETSAQSDEQTDAQNV